MKNKKKTDWMFVLKVVLIVVFLAIVAFLFLWMVLNHLDDSKLEKEYCKDQGGMISHTPWQGVSCDLKVDGERYERYIVEKDEWGQFILVK